MAARRCGHAGPRNPRRRSAATRRAEDPDRFQLLRRLRPRDPEEACRASPGRSTDGGPIVDPRWTGSGWTIFNNKGKPVRQYEPFFTATHAFEFDMRAGVSPVLFYDPVERVVATLHPNHTYEKVVFDPWQQTTYDVNDTVTFDPKTDPGCRRILPASFLTPTICPPGTAAR